MRFRVYSVALLILSGIETSFADPPLLVREHADLSRLVIEGNDSFSDDQIRRSLERNLELLALRRRLAPYFKFEQALGRLIRSGYLHAGFADVVVDVAYDVEGEYTVVTIVEGARYLCGQIDVSGVDRSLAEHIESRLAQTVVPTEEMVFGVRNESTGEIEYGFDSAGDPIERLDPTWRPGHPTRFHESSRFWEQNRVLQALGEKGLYGGVIHTVVTVDESQSTATLHVDVEDPGRAVVVTEVDVVGTEINSPQQVLDYLELGLPLSYCTDVQRELYQKLWECGRFRGFSVELEDSDLESKAARLRIELAEYDAAPRLTEDLNETDEILRRAAKWFTTVAGRETDLIISGKLLFEDWRQYITFDVAVSMGHGVVSEFALAPEEANGTAERSLFLLLTPEQLVVTSGVTGQCLEFGFRDPLQIRPALSFLGLPEIDSDGHQLSTRFGVGIQAESGAGVQSRFLASPMAMLDHVRTDDSVYSLSDGILSIRAGDLEAEFDAKSGRWLRYAMCDDESREIIELRFEDNGFETIAQRAESAGDVQARASSVPAFVAGEIAAFLSHREIENREGVIVLAALSSSLGMRINSHRYERGNSRTIREFFDIPWSPAQGDLPFPSEVLQPALAANGLLFPRDSTFGEFGRELVIGMTIQDEDAAGNIQRLLESSSTGPLFFWYVAELSKFLNPMMSQAIAREGQNRLDRRRFETDCRQLLTRDDVLKDVIEDCITSLRELDDSQLDALFAPVATPEQRAAIIATLREDETSDLDMLLSLLGELWDAKLRDLLQQRLIDLSGGSEIRNASRGLREESSVAETRPPPAAPCLLHRADSHP